MAKFRHEMQRYGTVADLQAETLEPTNNDSVYVETTGREYYWNPTSVVAEDGSFVIAQASIATGRWVASSAANVFTGTGTSDAMKNGQSSSFDVVVTGATIGAASLISITNADQFPANVFVTSKAIRSADTVTIVIENQSGGDVPAQNVNVSVLVF